MFDVLEKIISLKLESQQKYDEMYAYSSRKIG